MRKQLTRRALAVLGALVIMAVCVMPAFAYNATVTGGTTTFKSYIYTTKTYGLFSSPPLQVPSVTIAYQVSPVSGTNGVVVAGTKNANGTLKSPTVYATANNTAMVQGSATASSVTFSSADSWTEVSSSGVTLNNTGIEGQYYCEKTITLNFSGVTFKRPGIFRFQLTPTSSTTSVAGLGIDSTPRYVDVYVNQNTSSTTDKDLVVSGYTIHRDANTVPDIGVNYGGNGATVPNAHKDNGFENPYSSRDVIIQKNVAGNQGDKETEFNFTINITGANPNTPYQVSVTDYNTLVDAFEAAGLEGEELAEEKEGTRNGYINSNRSNLSYFATMLPMLTGNVEDFVKANSRTGLTADYTLVTNASGNATYNFKLADGDYAVIYDLPSTAQYSVTEAEQDYAPAWAVYGNTATPTSGSTNTVTSRTVGNNDNGVLFTNTREVPVATGIETAVLPFAMLAVLGLGAVAVIIVKKTRKPAEKGAC